MDKDDNGEGFDLQKMDEQAARAIATSAVDGTGKSANFAAFTHLATEVATESGVAAFQRTAGSAMITV